ncbi:M3 family metallopeptidase [Corynebacterium diphtheriae]|nr:M3 family metallopeptidase [Corynebacterium diphtheriae]
MALTLVRLHFMTNPLLQPSNLPYQLPPFAEIRVEHYLPAFTEALARHSAEIAAIANNPEPATWENTVEAWERSGRDLERVAAVFFNLHGTDSNAEMDEIAAEIAPVLAQHSDEMYLNAELFERIKQCTPPADSESQRLHEHIIRTFTRHGAGLEDVARLKEINARLSVLSDKFGRNLLESTKKLAVGFASKDELAGLSEARIESAAADAKALGRDGYVLPLGLPTVQGEQSALENPQSRQRVYEASQRRGADNNLDVLVEMVQLRAERAELLGYPTHADYVISEETAGSAKAARKLLYDLAPAATANALAEKKLLSEAAGQDITPADWPYWESQVRRRDYALDEEELSQHFPLKKVLVNGVFFAAHRLYGITVEPRPDLEGYAPGVEVWEVKDEDGSGIGLLLTDYYGRPSKRGGAWMSSFVDQSELLGTKPVVVNVMGLTAPTDDSDALLSIDSLTTVFHEFGHALHGLLSQVRYPTFSGTNVPRDYVEFPSQINENWAFEPEVLRNYAPNLPAHVVDAIEEARQFGQGFATTEYLAAAIIDLAWHSLTSAQAQKLSASDIEEFERRALEDAGIEGIQPRYKSTYFNHIFAGGYSAGYYSYLWAEALDADGFDWFKEQEDPRQAGQRFRDLVLSRGGADDFTAAYEALRGREKDVAPLLRRRGLAGAM